MFEEDHCWQCMHHDPDSDRQTKTCMIWANAIMNWPCVVKEWVYKNNRPTCTKFISWNWGTDGDPDDPDNPKAPPPPPDPNQLDMFPLYPDERIFRERPELYPYLSENIRK